MSFADRPFSSSARGITVAYRRGLRTPAPASASTASPSAGGRAHVRTICVPGEPFRFVKYGRKVDAHRTNPPGAGQPKPLDLQAEPSDGLEPSTPSSPWKVEGVTSVHGRSRMVTKSLQSAAIRGVQARRPESGRSGSSGRGVDALPSPFAFRLSRADTSSLTTFSPGSSIRDQECPSCPEGRSSRPACTRGPAIKAADDSSPAHERPKRVGAARSGAVTSHLWEVPACGFGASGRRQRVLRVGVCGVV